MRFRFVLLSILLALGLGVAPAIAQVPDIDCDDPLAFAAYQSRLRSTPPDPNGLAADAYGIACQEVAPDGDEYTALPSNTAPSFNTAFSNPFRRDVGYSIATGQTYELAPYNQGFQSRVLGVTSITPPLTGDAGIR